MNRYCLPLIAAALLFLACQFSLADDPSPSRESEGLQATEQKIAVNDRVHDVSIERRIRSIMQASDRFSALAVTVENGIVTLAGQTSSSEFRQWASEVASKTEDVVAVVNNIEVSPGSIWSLQPAADELHELAAEVVRALPMFAVGIFALLVSIAASRRIAALAGTLMERRIDNILVRAVLEKVILVALILLGVYIFLRVSGLTQLAVTVVGGTGIIGLILGFAFRDIAENFLASILISVQRPFRLGDTVEVEGYLGVVQRVTMRGTVLMDFEGNHIQIANATVYKSTIKNFTANPKMRIDFVIGIGYDSNIVDAQDAALSVLQEHSAVLTDPAPNILVESLGSATVNLRIHFWIDGNKFSKLKVRSAIMRQVVRRFEREGISLPDDSREVIFPQGVPLRMPDDGSVPAVLTEKFPARDEGARSPRRAQKQNEQSTATEHTDSVDEATLAEGGLTSESAEISRQAAESRSPEEGGDVLGDGNEKSESAG